MEKYTREEAEAFAKKKGLELYIGGNYDFEYGVKVGRMSLAEECKTLKADNERLREALQRAYDFLSPISNKFEGRDTIEGQWMLSCMRSAINHTKP